MSGRPTGVGGKESVWKLSQQPVREIYWSWREGVRVETVSTACPGILLELEGRSPSGDCLNRLSGRPTGAGGKDSEWTVSTACTGIWSWSRGTPEIKLMRMDVRHQRWINTMTHQGSTPNK